MGIGAALAGAAGGMLAGAASATVRRRRLDSAAATRTREQLLSSFARFPVTPGDVVMLGDSITAAGPWHEVLPGVPLRNRGVPGDTTGDVLARLGQVTAGRPGQVFLLVGTNDLGVGLRQGDILRHHEALLWQLRTEAPDAEVVVQSVLPRERRCAGRVQALNAGLAALARHSRCQYLDLWPVFATPDGALRAELTNDGLHLLGEGYERWAEVLRPRVARP